MILYFLKIINMREIDWAGHKEERDRIDAKIAWERREAWAKKEVKRKLWEKKAQSLIKKIGLWLKKIDKTIFMNHKGKFVLEKDITEEMIQEEQEFYF